MQLKTLVSQWSPLFCSFCLSIILTIYIWPYFTAKYQQSSTDHFADFNCDKVKTSFYTVSLFSWVLLILCYIHTSIYEEWCICSLQLGLFCWQSQTLACNVLVFLAFALESISSILQPSRYEPPRCRYHRQAFRRINV